MSEKIQVNIKQFNRLMKKKSLSSLKKELDDLFSLYVRQRDADEDGYNQCATCKYPYHWKNLQCGHYYSRKILSLRYNEQNTAPQCVSCNIYNEGEKPAFALYLKEEYGENILEKLEIKKNSRSNIDRFWFEIQIKYYKEKCEKFQ